MHSNDYIRHCAIADGFGGSVQSWCYVAALLETRGVNGDNYRNTVLLNMLRPDIRSVFGDYYLSQQDGAPAHCARDTVTMLQRERERERETPEFILLEMWPPNSPDLNPVDYNIWVCFKKGFTARGSMMWRSWKKVCWGSGGSWTTPS